MTDDRVAGRTRTKLPSSGFSGPLTVNISRGSSTDALMVAAAQVFASNMGATRARMLELAKRHGVRTETEVTATQSTEDPAGKPFLPMPGDANYTEVFAEMDRELAAMSARVAGVHEI